MTRVDLNCDMAEGTTPQEIARDIELLRYVSSANLCGGAYAGSPAALDACLRAAQQMRVAIGAHPGYADPESFGRRPLHLPAVDVAFLVAQQIQYVADRALKLGAQLHHVKLHGALYHQAAATPELAKILSQTILQFDRRLRLYAPAGSPFLAIAQRSGLRVVPEYFLDRQYAASGDLIPRDQPNALVADAEMAAERLLSLLEHGGVEAVDGGRIALQAETACLHSDHPSAVAFAQRVHARLTERGCEIRSPGN